MFLNGEIKQLETIICSLFFQFTHNLKKQISAIFYYPSEKFLVKVVYKRGGKRSGEDTFCNLMSRGQQNTNRNGKSYGI